MKHAGIYIAALVGAALVILGGWLGGRAYFGRSGDAEVVVEPQGFDFADRRQAEELLYSFTLRNKLSYPITLVGIHSTCGCATVPGILVGRTIDAADSCELPVTLNTGNADGPVSGQVMVYYRAGTSTRMCGLELSANVLPDYRVEPAALDFGKIDQLGAVTKRVRIRPEMFPGFRVLGVRSSHRQFSARLAEESAGQGVRHVDITFAAENVWRTESFSAIVTVETNSPRAPRAEVAVRARLVPPVEIEPPSVVVRWDESGRVERRLRITSRAPSRLSAVRCPEPGVHVDADLAREAQEHVLRLALVRPEMRTPNCEIQVELALRGSTGKSEACRVSFPVHCLPRGEVIR